MADPLIVDVEKRFPSGVVIAADMHVSMSGGGILVLFGPSGSGKTTLLRCIAGLERPDRGTIRFAESVWFDKEQSRFVDPQARGAAFVFQHAALFPHLTVRGNVEYGLGDLSAAERAARGNEMLALFELRELADRHPRQISGGQAQRVAVARALAPHPRLLLLDEPFAALDTPTRGQLRRLLRLSVARLGIAVVLVTHDRTEAMALGDQMAVLAEGRIRQVGAVLDVFRRPADLVVARSVGIDSVLPGRVESAADGLVDIRVGRRVVRALNSGLDADTRDVFVCIRAEDVTIERSSPSHASARNHLPGRIVAVASEGPVDRVTIDCGFPLTALVTREAREEMGLQPGAPIVAAIKATAVHLVPRS